ncbi:hypothetical protein SARC_07249 [Sphaeroforma arctica JP610]|uniref:Uncharacterized protein n=1 Tax=Sphaeroforma arctica JP610 TaxID=667725 RepID=A0A0L0FU87_9EUKA|nr:hypothetical protein SARC_07249 [Sphaeroforma arctica JP610]KNC80392.1 hypothetical protein SARC_07249 [Sphaeroforma arctica JP610]|eukprot:XP_014154294.1 hypothetical protein SARC_07249 [Sphaeroforma arctica JP610]
MMASTSPPQAEPLPSLLVAPLLSLCISAIEEPTPHIFNAITNELHTLTQKPVQAHVLKHTSVKESVQLACVSYLERHENTATERELLAVLGCLLALLSGLNGTNKQELGYQPEHDLQQSRCEHSSSEFCSSATATARHESYARVLTVLARIAAPTHMVRYTNTSSQAPHRSHEKADEVVQMAVECLEGYFGLMRMENQTEMDNHTKDVQSRGSSVVVLFEQNNTQNRPHDLSGDMKGIPRPGSRPQTNNSIQQNNEHNILISYIIAVLLAYVEVGQRLWRWGRGGVEDNAGTGDCARQGDRSK